MKPTRQREPLDMLGSDTAASHFVPLGDVVEEIVRRAHEKRQYRHHMPMPARANDTSGKSGDCRQHGGCENEHRP